MRGLRPEAVEAGPHVRPGVESMPGQVQVRARRLIDVIERERAQYDVEVAPMQRVELAERQAAAADVVHRRLVLAAPGVREGEPVDGDAARGERRFRFTRDRAPPVDERAEHVEQQCMEGRHRASGRCRCRKCA